MTTKKRTKKSVEETVEVDRDEAPVERTEKEKVVIREPQPEREVEVREHRVVVKS